MTTKRLPTRVRRAAEDFGEDIRTWRKISNLTVADVARRADLSQSTVMRLEKGDTGVSLGAVLCVAKALGRLETMENAMDPMASDIGQLRLRERLPQRVHR